MFWTGHSPLLKIAPSHVVSPSNTWFLGSTRVHIPNGISIGPAVFAGLTIVTGRQADYATPSVTIGRIYVVLRCGLTILWDVQSCTGFIQLCAINAKTKAESADRNRLEYILLQTEYSVVCRSVFHNVEPCKNGSTGRDAVWVVDLGWPRESCIRWGSDLPCEGAIVEREGAAHCKVCGLLDVSCSKTAEPIEMLFGVWTRMGPRKHVLDGVHISATWQIRLNR